MCTQANLVNPFAAAKTNTRLPGAAAHSSRCFHRFVSVDNIPLFSTPAGAHDGAMAPCPPNARTTVLYRRESRDSDWAIGALGERTS